MKITIPNLAFNAAVMTMANKVCPTGYDVFHNGSAPDSFEKLNAHIKSTGRILVDGRNSENTIFGCPEHNWAFRAWHDWTHWHIQAPFTLDGEIYVAGRQIHDLRTIFGTHTDWERIIYAEVVGQAEYFAAYGEFPSDQVAFDRAYLLRIHWQGATK